MSTTLTPLFADGHYKGVPAKISRVFKVTPPQGMYRTQPEPYFGVRVRCANIIETLKFPTREAADRKYAELTYVDTTPEGQDRDEQDRAVAEIMLSHYEARIDPQPDGSLDVIVDGGDHRYYVSPDGSDFYCAASVED